MQDRDDYTLPEQSALPDENKDSDTPKQTMAQRRKAVGVTHGADHSRLKALEYLGRRWLSLR
ncbi:hypothetical protein U8C36_12045 [Sinorhizobium medicae]|uniref:hypothetical protein n=1 Tax=Sinorhizobium medicae TaxID=110321 RepID=UPI00299DB248|nr:hypothetical protein [Sinorhizobium medicae]WQO50694.1 hypothetical protein U8C36_12045 [Sinorhizobium medicae]